MSFFKNLFGNKETADQKLATGELNWRLKPTIRCLTQFPNYKSFIEQEEKKGFQFGLHNEVNDDVSFTLILTQPVYDLNDIAVKRFSLFFQGFNVPEHSFISMMGIITNFDNPSEMNFPNREHIAQVILDNFSDKPIEIYIEKYNYLFNEALKKQGLNTSEFKLIGKICYNKIGEKHIRDKYK